ncbi:hypothetical protein C8J55DRAFT_493848 [Lentinula edodes]|uniref:Uncharacterized protein n=1 Tax=Lentinula lateritia TaxID=40482 RepID=A0A9W8ZRW5_9AGAR|nr:hypothetical protein C8J55DRAFT_493848 [Lentinula edodes]
MSSTSSNTSNYHLPQQNSERQVRFIEESTVYLHEKVKYGDLTGYCAPHIQNEGRSYESSSKPQFWFVSPTMGKSVYGEASQFQHKDQYSGSPSSTSDTPSPEGVAIVSPTTAKCHSPKLWQGQVSSYQFSPATQSETFNQPVPQTPLISTIPLPDVDDEDKIEGEEDSLQEE